MVETSIPQLDPLCFGKLLVTGAASEVLTTGEVMEMYTRHMRNDWGDLSEEDAAENEAVVRACASNDQDPGRIFSVYKTTSTEEKIYIITYPRPEGEYQSVPDYCNTTILLASDY